MGARRRKIDCRNVGGECPCRVCRGCAAYVEPSHPGWCFTIHILRQIVLHFSHVRRQAYVCHFTYHIGSGKIHIGHAGSFINPGIENSPPASVSKSRD